MTTKIFIGADHGGFSLKNHIVNWLHQINKVVIDHGTFSQNSCDYPVFAKKVCSNVIENPLHRGILICKTGIGMCIAANKIKQIRAALVTQPELAKLARQHNNINVLCLNGDLNPTQAVNIIQNFLETTFSQEQRHVNRLNMLEY